MPGTGQRYPGEVDEVHPEPFIKMPPQPREKKPGQLSPEQLRQYFEEGYVIIEDFFSRAELDPCRDAIAEQVEDLAQKLFAAGKIKSLYEEEGLFQRLTKMEADHTGSNILLFKKQKMSKPFRDLWSNKRMLNIMEQLLGPEVAGHPVWNLRTKTPRNDATIVPWHQDSGYLSNASYAHQIPTAWIPMLDANEQNGCMQVVRKGHLLGKVARHKVGVGSTYHILLEEQEMTESLGCDLEKDVVTCEIPYGGFLLFHNLTPHRSLANVSNDVRWSVDLRWQSPDAPWGFYNIQEGLLLRSAKNPNLAIDWDKFLKVDRKEIWKQRYMKNPEAHTSEFDTTVTGPWIGRWEVINNNKHIQAFKFEGYKPQ